MNITFNNADIRFYFSFQCPYSYISWELMKTILKDAKLTVQPINIGLNPPGNSKFHFREIWSEKRWQRLIADAKALEIPMSKPEKYVSDLTSARAIELYGPYNAEDYISSIFKGFFVNGVDISAPSALKYHLQADGIDSSIFSAAIEDVATEKAFNEQTLLWGHHRIRTIPTIECQDDRICGLIEKSPLERHLRSIMD